MEKDENITGNLEASKLATFSIYSRQESQPNQDDQTTTQDSRRAQDTITNIEFDTVQDSHETCDDQGIQESQGTHDNNLTMDKESSKQTKGIKIKAIRSLANIRGQISTLSGEGKQEITSFFTRESKAFREEMKKDLYQYPEEDIPVDIHELFKEWKGEGKASFGYWKKIFQRRPGERCNDLQVYPHMRNVRGICQPIAHHIVVFKPLCCSDCQSDLGWQLQDTGTR